MNESKATIDTILSNIIKDTEKLSVIYKWFNHESVSLKTILETHQAFKTTDEILRNDIFKASDFSNERLKDISDPFNDYASAYIKLTNVVSFMKRGDLKSISGMDIKKIALFTESDALNLNQILVKPNLAKAFMSINIENGYNHQFYTTNTFSSKPQYQSEKYFSKTNSGFVHVHTLSGKKIEGVINLNMNLDYYISHEPNGNKSMNLSRFMRNFDSTSFLNDNTLTIDFSNMNGCRVLKRMDSDDNGHAVYKPIKGNTISRKDPNTVNLIYYTLELDKNIISGVKTGHMTMKISTADKSYNVSMSLKGKICLGQ